MHVPPGQSVYEEASLDLPTAQFVGIKLVPEVGETGVLPVELKNLTVRRASTLHLNLIISVLSRCNVPANPNEF